MLGSHDCQCTHTIIGLIHVYVRIAKNDEVTSGITLALSKEDGGGGGGSLGSPNFYEKNIRARRMIEGQINLPNLPPMPTESNVLFARIEVKFA